MRVRFRGAAGAAALALLLTGCTAAPAEDHEGIAVTHVHAVVAGQDGFVLGTHEGVFALDPDGELGERVSAYGFDAMGLTAAQAVLFASGHPGLDTPASLGKANLGIIRSDDGGRTWEPVAFTGEKDFHALASAPDGVLYGQPTDSNEVLRSDDGGETWQPTGAEAVVYGMAVDASGALLAVTADGVLVSRDGGAVFAPLVGAPALYLVAASPDRSRIVGVDIDGTIWSRVGDGEWDASGAAHGDAQAIGVDDSGTIVIVDEGGVRMM